MSARGVYLDPPGMGSLWGVESEGMPSLTLEWGQDTRVDFSKNKPFMFGHQASVSSEAWHSVPSQLLWHPAAGIEARDWLRREKAPWTLCLPGWVQWR